MGWKTFKEHFKITYIVHTSEYGISIGSPYIPTIIRVGLDGVIKRREDTQTLKLREYQQAIERDPDLTRRLIEAEDVFAADIPVYTWEGDQIIRKYCEQPGHPNVTHDGQLMYDNMFHTDRNQVLQWALDSAKSWLIHSAELVKRCKNDLEFAEKEHEQTVRILQSLEWQELNGETHTTNG